MTFGELLEGVLTLCPDAEIGEDNYGQLIVHTGLAQADEGDELVPWEDGS